MKIELITSVERLQGSSYFEFYPGAHQGAHWSPDSVYLHMHVFDLVAHVFRVQIREFAYFGPTTISGRRIEELAKGLDEFATAVNRAETPEAIWGPNERMLDEELSDELEDWSMAKRQLSVVPRELSLWMRGVAARREPVTILGI